MVSKVSFDSQLNPEKEILLVYDKQCPACDYCNLVLNEEYASQIAERWNVPASGAGYVTAFDVDAAYLNKFQEQQVGALLLVQFSIGKRGDFGDGIIHYNLIYQGSTTKRYQFVVLYPFR